jgi:hypothetical protein
MRWLRAETVGGSLEARAKAVAESEKIPVYVALRSLRMVEQYRASNEQIEMDYAIRDFVRSALPKAKQSLEGLLEATELVEVKNDKTGKTRVTRMPDKTTRLEAQRLVKDLIIGLQPKGPLVAQNIQQTTQVAAISASTETNEERLARLREKAREYNALPPKVAGVPEHLDTRGDEGDDEDGFNGEGSDEE